MTCVISKSTSSTALASWYVGDPSGLSSVTRPNRSAPSASGPPIWCAASRWRTKRLLWWTGPSSQRTPSHSRSAAIVRAPSSTFRAASVSSTRRSIVPPPSSAKRRFATALSALPRWSEPVGLGAKRTRIVTRRMLLGTRRANSVGHEREIRLQRVEVEPVRSLPVLEEVRADQAVRLVAVAIPERPRHLLQLAPRDHGHAVRVVANDVDRMAAPRAGTRRTGQRVRPVPARLVLRGDRELQAD